MSDLTVASTTDAQKDIDAAAGVTTKEQEPEVKEGEEVEPEAAASPTQEEKKPKSAYQKRIDALVKQRSQAEAQVSELRARLEALEQRTAPSKAQVVEEAPAKEPVTSQDDPEPKEDDPRWTSYKDFVKAQAQWEIRQQLKEIQKKQVEEDQKKAAQAAQDAVMNAYRSRVDEARERYDDWDEITNRDVQVFDGVKTIIVEHPNGPDLQYYLQKNPKIAKEMMDSGLAMAMARAGSIADQLGQTESEVPTSDVVNEGKEPTRRRIAPAPIRPVGGSSTKSSVPLDELDYQSFAKIRAQQEKNRYRR